MWIEISTKFGMLIDFDLPKRDPSLNPQPEVRFLTLLPPS